MLIKPDDFTHEVPSRGRTAIGVCCVFIGVFSGIAAWLSSDIVIVILSFVAGFPISLVGLSLLFGKAQKGDGLFSSFTLCLIGTLLIIAAVAGTYSGTPDSSVGILFGLGCFALAKKRSSRR